MQVIVCQRDGEREGAREREREREEGEHAQRTTASERRVTYTPRTGEAMVYGLGAKDTRATHMERGSRNRRRQ